MSLFQRSGILIWSCVGSPRGCIDVWIYRGIVSVALAGEGLQESIEVLQDLFGYTDVDEVAVRLYPFHVYRPWLVSCRWCWRCSEDMKARPKTQQGTARGSTMALIATSAAA